MSLLGATASRMSRSTIGLNGGGVDRWDRVVPAISVLVPVTPSTATRVPSVPSVIRCRSIVLSGESGSSVLSGGSGSSVGDGWGNDITRRWRSGIGGCTDRSGYIGSRSRRPAARIGRSRVVDNGVCLTCGRPVSRDSNRRHCRASGNSGGRNHRSRVADDGVGLSCRRDGSCTGSNGCARVRRNRGGKGGRISSSRYRNLAASYIVSPISIAFDNQRGWKHSRLSMILPASV